MVDLLFIIRIKEKRLVEQSAKENTDLFALRNRRNFFRWHMSPELGVSCLHGILFMLLLSSSSLTWDLLALYRMYTAGVVFELAPCVCGARQ